MTCHFHVVHNCKMLTFPLTFLTLFLQGNSPEVILWKNCTMLPNLLTYVFTALLQLLLGVTGKNTTHSARDAWTRLPFKMKNLRSLLNITCFFLTYIISVFTYSPFISLFIFSSESHELCMHHSMFCVCTAILCKPGQALCVHSVLSCVCTAVCTCVCKPYHCLVYILVVDFNAPVNEIIMIFIVIHNT